VDLQLLQYHLFHQSPQQLACSSRNACVLEEHASPKKSAPFQVQVNICRHQCESCPHWLHVIPSGIDPCVQRHSRADAVWSDVARKQRSQNLLRCGSDRTESRCRKVTLMAAEPIFVGRAKNSAALRATTRRAGRFPRQQGSRIVRLWHSPYWSA
jgi:hypothetical protein